MCGCITLHSSSDFIFAFGPGLFRSLGIISLGANSLLKMVWWAGLCMNLFATSDLMLRCFGSDGSKGE